MRICVFCGAANGNRPEYLAAAKELGRKLAERGIGLVYGGASIGLMGAVADAALEAGGEVIGVIPQLLIDKEVAHKGLKDLRVTNSMMERKEILINLADAFIALPGGIGTLDEIFEVWTGVHLNQFSKPFGLLNTAGFYKPLELFLDRIDEDGFFRHNARHLVIVEETVDAMLAKLGA